MNLFEQFDDIINPNFIKGLSAQITDNQGNLETAIKGVCNTLIAGLIRRSNSEMSAGMLFNQIKEKYQTSRFDEDFLINIKDSNFLNDSINEGSKIISQIFPAYKSPLLSLIGSYANTSKSTAVFASSVTALALVKILGRKIESEKMDKQDLIQYLRGHNDALFEKTPPEFMDKLIPALGLQELTTVKPYTPSKKADAAIIRPETESVAEPTYQIEDDEQDNTGSFLNKKLILGLLIAAILGAIGYFGWLNKDKIFVSAPKSEVDEEMQYIDSLNTAKPDSIKLDTIKVQAKDSLVRAEGSGFLEMKNNVISSTESAGGIFEFSSINYVGQTNEIEAGSMATIDSIASLMNNNKRLQIQIVATSESGEQKLNNKRAFAIKRQLIKRGIEGLKIDAISGGIGGNNPKIKVITK